MCAWIRAFVVAQPIQNLMRALVNWVARKDNSEKAEQKAIISIYVVREIACSEA